MSIDNKLPLQRLAETLNHRTLRLHEGFLPEAGKSEP